MEAHRNQIKKYWQLKRRAMRKAFLKWRLKGLYKKTKYGFEAYSCGHKMLLGISSEYYNTCKNFNLVADKLAKIDSNCPSFRYDLS